MSTFVPDHRGLDDKLRVVHRGTPRDRRPVRCCQVTCLGDGSFTPDPRFVPELLGDRRPWWSGWWTIQWLTVRGHRSTVLSLAMQDSPTSLPTWGYSPTASVACQIRARSVGRSGDAAGIHGERRRDRAGSRCHRSRQWLSPVLAVWGSGVRVLSAPPRLTRAFTDRGRRPFWFRGPEVARIGCVAGARRTYLRPGSADAPSDAGWILST